MSDRKLPAVAIVAFLAGAIVGSAGTLWKTRSNSAMNQPGAAAFTANGQQQSGAANAMNASVGAGTKVFINEKEISPEQVSLLTHTYGAAPPPGNYWYDPRSGLYGYWGREAAGYIKPGHDFGDVPAQASGGNTGVFINGREINLTEAQFFQRLFGVVYQGHFWLDGATGNLGVEGNPTPLANLVVAMQRAQGSGSSEYHWRDGSGAVIGGEGNCTFAAIPGAPVYSTPGCG